MGSSQLAALDAIEHYALSTPHSLALQEPNGLTLSYKELWAQVQMLTDRLEEAGIAAGETVAVLLPEGALHVLAVTGVLNRHVAILLSARTAPTALEPTLLKLSASALIAASEFEAEIKTAIRLGLTVLVAGKGESPRDWQVRAAAFPLKKSVVRSRPGLFLFSSGTTGASKIVFWSDSNINAGIAFRQRSTQLTSSDRLLFMITLCNGAGVINALTQFTAGGSIIATGGFDHSAYVRWLNQLKPTWYVCAPIVHQASLTALREEVIDRPVSLRFLESAGAPLNEEVRQGLEQILGVPVLNVYGANEVQYVARKAPSSGGLDPNPDSAGVSCGLEISIMDSFGMSLPTGEEGEISVRGPTVTSGYVENPEATQAAFQDGWFKTGDVGRLDEFGNLFVTGRLKEMINRGGEKVAPSEVDAVMASHPAVLEAVTFAVPHPTLGEAVACAVILEPSIEPAPQIAELRRFAAEHLARFKVPSRIFIVNEIPRGELGKPLRWLLAERLADRRATAPSAAEMTEHASDVVFYRAYEIWSRLLDRDDLGFDENFFDAGGDSLGAISMLAEVDQRFGSQISALAGSFLDEPTLARLVELVGTPPLPRPIDNESSELRIFPLRVQDSPQRFFCVPGNGDEGLYFRRLATHLHGIMDFFTVRPANTWMSQSLFTFEDAGIATAKLIREVQGEGPYLVGGFCSGGVVAVEAARHLIREGADVRLVLFDVYMPGYPSFLRDWRTWFESARAQWHERGKSGRTNFALNPGYVLRRLIWSAITPIRRLLVPVERLAIVQWFLRKALKGNLPFYEATPIKAPILHFLCADEANVIDRESRYGWRAMARNGVTEEFVAFDHMNLFHESNLPKIVETLLRWSISEKLASQPRALEQTLESTQSEVRA